MAADQLLAVLSLYGFGKAEQVAPALQEACKSEAANEMVQWLAENLKPEHLPGRDSTESAYELSTRDRATADSFAESLRRHDDPEESPDDVSREERRATTAAVLEEAREGLKREAEKAAEIGRREHVRLESSLMELNEKVDSCMRELVGVFDDLRGLTSQLNSLIVEESGSERLVCFRALAEYRDLDVKLMAALRNHYSSQFGYALEELDFETGAPDIERLLFGESESVVAARAVEIERLRLGYAGALEGKVRMEALRAKSEKSLQALQGALTRTDLSSQDAAMLRHEVEKQTASLERMLARKKQILEVELPRLCHDLGSTHCWDVVKADYDLELQRNKYFLSKKDFVLDILVARAARIAALVTVAKGEAEALTGAQAYLETVEDDVRSLRIKTENRLAAYEAVLATPPPEGPPKSPYKMPQAELVLEKQAAFSRQVAELVDGAVPRMQRSSGELHALSFKDAGVGNPELTPETLAAALGEIQAVTAKLMEANETVYRQQENYNNLMRTQRDQVGVERSVFHTFFTRPSELDRLAQEAAGELPGRKAAGKASPGRGSPPKSGAPKLSARKPKPTR